ncbi:hypothetical protein E2R51_18935 [Jeotgalibacillus sp. S-D1]|nr:hypothetical protein E2R51_18935 [Jeotgalibacillus sp. S-D1]
MFSLTFSVYGVGSCIDLFKAVGIYAGMKEFLTDIQLKIVILFGLMIIFFMILASLKLIAETINSAALLFFSKERDGKALQQARSGSMIYLTGSLLSAVSLHSFIGLFVIFLITSFIYFIYFVVKVSSKLSLKGTVGVILFEIMTWLLLLSSVLFVAASLYNGIMESLPILKQV